MAEALTEAGAIEEDEDVSQFFDRMWEHLRADELREIARRCVEKVEVAGVPPSGFDPTAVEVVPRRG